MLLALFNFNILHSTCLTPINAILRIFLKERICEIIKYYENIIISRDTIIFLINKNKVIFSFRVF